MKTDVQNQRCERTKMQGPLTSMIMTNQIEAFPTHHLDAMRGLQKVSFILLDESVYKLRQVYFL